jgi:hypothetical protein
VVAVARAGHGFEEHSAYRSKAEVLNVLARTGIPKEAIAEISTKLPDPVDLDEQGALLQAYGVTRDGIISQLGGSL